MDFERPRKKKVADSPLITFFTLFLGRKYLRAGLVLVPFSLDYHSHTV